VLASITLHVGLFMWLLKEGPGRSASHVGAGTRLWLLARPASPVALIEPKPATVLRASARPTIRSRRSTAAGADIAAAVVSAAPETISKPLAGVSGNEIVGGFSGEGRAAASDTFRRNIFQSQGADSLQPVAILPLTHRDSSLLGRVAHMQRAVLCGELRAALRRPGNEASLEAIQASMARLGCR